MRWVPAAVLTVALVLAGCTAVPAAAPSATPSPSMSPVVVSSIGPGHQTPVVPKGARSAVVRFTCGGGSTYSISFAGEVLLAHGGTCGSTATYDVDLSTPFAFDVDFPNGGSYVAQIDYSPQPFREDAATASQCTAFGKAYSDVASAENGYPAQLDRAGWDGLIARAASEFEAMDASGAIGSQMRALTVWWGSAPPPGPSDSPALAQAQRAVDIVNQLCDDNGTPAPVVSQYGG